LTSTPARLKGDGWPEVGDSLWVQKKRRSVSENFILYSSGKK